VFVTNLGGLGAETTGDGIMIVEVDGTSAAGILALGGPAIGGAYTYNLFQNGIADPTDGDWYLRAAALAPTVPVYENYPNIMLGMIEMPTFQQRRGNIYMPSSTDSFMVAEPTADVAGYAPPPGNVWARIEAPFGHYAGNSDTGMEYDLSRFLVQIGIDGQLSESDSGMLIAGINAQYGHGHADISSDLDSGDNSTDSFGGGLSLTWLGKSGSYVDAQASAHFLQSDLSSAAVGDLVSDNEGSGYGLSLEAGHKLSFDEAWSVTPQAQLAYTSVDFDDFTDPFGADVSLQKGESLKGRIGLAFSRDSFVAGESRTHVYAVANLTYEFLGEQSVDVAGVNVTFEPQRFGGELGLGGTSEWAGGKYALQAEALGQTSFEGSYGIKGTVGFSTRF
jgi:fibronectin-binding autotransporter adhesin